MQACLAELNHRTIVENETCKYIRSFSRDFDGARLHFASLMICHVIYLLQKLVADVVIIIV